MPTDEPIAIASWSISAARNQRAFQASLQARTRYAKRSHWMLPVFVALGVGSLGFAYSGASDNSSLNSALMAVGGMSVVIAVGLLSTNRDNRQKLRGQIEGQAPVLDEPMELRFHAAHVEIDAPRGKGTLRYADLVDAVEFEDGFLLGLGGSSIAVFEDELVPAGASAAVLAAVRAELPKS